MIALRDLSAIRILKYAVATGLVIGISPKTTPTAAAISVTLRSSSTLMVPAPTLPTNDW